MAEVEQDAMQAMQDIVVLARAEEALRLGKGQAVREILNRVVETRKSAMNDFMVAYPDIVLGWIQTVVG